MPDAGTRQAATPQIWVSEPGDAAGLLPPAWGTGQGEWEQEKANPAGSHPTLQTHHQSMQHYKLIINPANPSTSTNLSQLIQPYKPQQPTARCIPELIAEA